MSDIERVMLPDRVSLAIRNALQAFSVCGNHAPMVIELCDDDFGVWLCYVRPQLSPLERDSIRELSVQYGNLRTVIRRGPERWST